LGRGTEESEGRRCWEGFVRRVSSSSEMYKMTVGNGQP